MEKMRFGLTDRGTELKELLNKREFALKAGNKVDKYDEALTGYSDLLIDPTLSVKLGAIKAKAIITPEDTAEMSAILKAQEEFRKNSPVLGLVGYIQTVLNGKKAQLVRISKKVDGFNGKKEDRIMSYLPGELRELYKVKDLSEARIPTSILRAIVETDTLKITGEEIMVVHLVSVYCDKYTGNYEQHLWSITYDLKEEVELTEKEMVEFDNIENEML